jgi:hypothetical protein
MGVHVHIAVVVERVSEEAWQRIYEMACRAAARWTPPPLSAGWRSIGNVRVAQYTTDIENANGLHLVGDAQTLAIGEGFIFPAALGKYECNDAESPASSYDVLLAVAHRNASPEQQLHYRDLFGAKTQGLPYSHAHRCAGAAGRALSMNMLGEG